MTVPSRMTTPWHDTPFFEKIWHPIVLAPKAGICGGQLAAAVSLAGGLGLIGCSRQSKEWISHECALASHLLEENKEPNSEILPFGVGFDPTSLQLEMLEAALAHHPACVFLSTGDVSPWTETIKRAGCQLICQVTTVAAAQTAVSLGANAIIARGSDAGGHDTATYCLVPAIVAAVGPGGARGGVPVLAARGVHDGWGMAAAVVLGASGVVMGTMFYNCDEALAPADDGDPAASTPGTAAPRPKRPAHKVVDEVIDSAMQRLTEVTEMCWDTRNRRRVPEW